MSRLLVTLVRHAKSSWRLGELDDLCRPLNARGLSDCRRVPKALKARLPVPDTILVSHATRAIQTADAIAGAFSLKGESICVVPELYLASSGTILEVVTNNRDGAQHLMAVGHNPGMTDLYNYLTGGSLDNMPTFGTAHLCVDANDWGRFTAGCAEVLDLVLPRQLS